MTCKIAILNWLTFHAQIEAVLVDESMAADLGFCSFVGQAINPKKTSKVLLTF